MKAKILLHNKLENKEHLTEHLYTMIHQNEIRKAEKLTTLMEQLNVEPSDKDEQVITFPSVPQLGIITMSNVTDKQYESISNSYHLAQVEHATIEHNLSKEDESTADVKKETKNHSRIMSGDDDMTTMKSDGSVKKNDLILSNGSSPTNNRVENGVSIVDTCDSVSTCVIELTTNNGVKQTSNTEDKTTIKTES